MLSSNVLKGVNCFIAAMGLFN